MQGEVYMRALHEFGSWGDIAKKDNALKNDYRGDLYSGVTAVFSSPDDSGYFANIPQDKRKHVKDCCLIDESDIQFFKIYSLYCYELDDAKQQFIAPDPRMAQFGDTAVMIIDFCEFLDRYAKALFAKYERLISMVDFVQPFDFQRTQWLNPLFCKHESQAYQKELRIAFGALKKNVFARGPGADDAYEIITNYDPVTLQLGDISDIAVEVPITDFLTCKLPIGFRCRWPYNERFNPRSNFEEVQAWTADQMRNYHSIHVRPVYTTEDGTQADEMLPFVEFLRKNYENRV